MSRLLNIVVVEDYDELCEAIVEKLRSDGHRVVGLRMAEEIDDEYTKFLADLFIIDLNLPGEDGIMLAKRICHNHPDAVIIMATARTSELDRVLGYEAGAYLYLPKPYSLSELRAIVTSVGNRLENVQTDRNISLRLDALRMQLFSVDGSVNLNQDEINLLSAFARTSDQTLERWQVASYFFALDINNMSSDAMKVKISRLRAKIISCGLKNNPIVSIKGYGYKLTVRIIIK